MRLNTHPRLLFITLVALSVLLSTSHSLVFAANAQEKKPETTEQNNETTTAAPKSNKTADKTIPATTEKTTEDAHQHQVIIRAPVNAFAQQQQDIKHYLAQEKITPLLVGPDNYLTTTDEHTTGINKGVMVLIPDWQQGISAPNALNQLRKNIPQYGWTTITLHPPSKPANYPSQALTAEERSSQNTETLTNYRQKLADIMRAVMPPALWLCSVVICQPCPKAKK